MLKKETDTNDDDKKRLDEDILLIGKFRHLM
jgi:hypothetical protein